jgi:cysteine-rich repeat protein
VAFWMRRTSFISASALLLATGASAATLTVNSAGDDTIAADGLVTLREAILAAEADAATDLGDVGSGADTIVFAPALTGAGDATISVAAMGDASFGLAAFLVTTEIAIAGPAGDDGVAIARAADISPLPSLRLFTVAPTGSLSLANLTLSGGSAVGGAGGDSTHPELLGGAGGGGAGLGGAIYNRGALATLRCTISGNLAKGGNGGRATDGSTALMTQLVWGSAGGGGLSGAGAAVISAEGGGGGGGSLSAGAVAVGSVGGDGGGDGAGGGAGGSGENVAGAAGGAGGGGGGGGGKANGGAGGVGGGGGGAGSAPSGVPNSGGAGGFGGGGGGGGFSPGDGGFGGGAGSNHAVFDAADPGYGGGAAGGGWSYYVVDASAGVHDAAGAGGGGAGLGGAVFNHGGTVRIDQSTFSGNQALAGLGGYAPPAHAAGQSGSALGGAVFDLNGSVEITDSTFAGNAAQLGPDLYVLAHGAASGIAVADAGATLSGVILASSGGRNAVFEAFFGAGAPGALALDASEPNLFSAGVDTFGSFDASGVVVADPELAALADNGGPTRTHAPLYPGSPAVDAGSAPGAGLDQRGEVRPSGPAADLGSVEVAQFCGNGVVEALEECDDANTTPGDGCVECLVRCATAPAPGCVAAGAATLAIDERKAGAEKLSLAMKRLADRVDLHELGDPLSGSTRYAICVYGQGLAVDVRLDRAGATCGTKPCWKETGLTGYAYADPLGAAEGVTAVKLKGGLAGKGAISVAGANDAKKGETSLATGAAAALAGATSATAQVLASDGECFEADLATVKKAAGGQFKAKAP